MKKEFKKIAILLLFLLVAFFSFFDDTLALSSHIYYPFAGSSLTYRTKGISKTRTFKAYATFKLKESGKTDKIAFCLEPGTTFRENTVTKRTYEQYLEHRKKFTYYTKGNTLNVEQQALLQKISTVANITDKSSEARILAVQALYWEVIMGERDSVGSCSSGSCFPDPENTTSLYPVLTKNPSLKSNNGTTSANIIKEYDAIVNDVYKVFEKNPGGVFKIKNSAPTVVLEYSGKGKWSKTITDSDGLFSYWTVVIPDELKGYVTVDKKDTSLTITATKEIKNKQPIELITNSNKPEAIAIYTGQENPSVQALFEGGKTTLSKYIYIETESTKFGLKINKKDADTGEYLSGAEFELCTTPDCSDDNKQRAGTSIVFSYPFPAVFEVEKTGTYYYREIKAPEGYKIDEENKIYSVEITDDNKYNVLDLVNLSYKVINFTNKKEEPITEKTTPAPLINYQLKINKIDSVTKKPLKGVQFRICADLYCKNILTTKTTDSNGEIKYSDLTNTGTYYVVEYKTIDGYILDTTTYDVEVNSENVATSNSFAEITIENSKKTYAFNLTKNTIDENGKITKLDDGCNSSNKSATFTVKDLTGKKLFFEKTEEGKYKLSTEGSEEIKTCNGAFSVEGLTECKYTIEETKAPEGLSLPNPASKEVNICGSDKNISFTNGFIGLEFQKKNENGEFIAGGKFSLEQKINGSWFDVKVTQKNEGVYTYTTDGENYEIITSAGIAYISGLPAGEYRMIEDQAPEGYELIEVADSPKITISNEYKDGYYILTMINHKVNKNGGDASAELIITITTGRKVLNYVLIVSSLAALLVIAIIIRKKIKK